MSRRFFPAIAFCVVVWLCAGSARAQMHTVSEGAIDPNHDLTFLTSTSPATPYTLGPGNSKTLCLQMPVTVAGSVPIKFSTGGSFDLSSQCPCTAFISNNVTGYSRKPSTNQIDSCGSFYPSEVSHVYQDTPSTFATTTANGLTMLIANNKGFDIKQKASVSDPQWKTIFSVTFAAVATRVTGFLSTNGAIAGVVRMSSPTTGNQHNNTLEIWVHNQNNQFESVGSMNLNSDFECGHSILMTADAKHLLIGCPGFKTEAADSVAIGMVQVMSFDGDRSFNLSYSMFPHMAGFQRYGTSIAISEDTSRLIVGAPGYQSWIGSVYTYRFNITHHERTLGAQFTPSISIGYARFGSSVALSSSGCTAVIGAPFASCDGDEYRSGAIFTMACSERGETPHALAHHQMLCLPRNLEQPGDKQLGVSVAITDDGTTVVAGAPRYFSNRGAVGVWNRPSAQSSTPFVLRSIVGPAPSWSPSSNEKTVDQDIGQSIDCSSDGARCITSSASLSYLLS